MQVKTDERISSGADVAISFLFSSYFGLVLGVSFLATMAKFQAKLTSLPQLVEIGSITFHWMHAVELFLVLALLILSGVTARRQRWRLVVSGLLGVLWLLQGFWLLPVLDQRVALFISAGTLQSSPDHFYYAALEGVKLIALAIAGPLCILQLIRTRRTVYEANQAG